MACGELIPFNRIVGSIKYELIKLSTIKMTDQSNIAAILERAKSVLGVDNDKDIAKLFGISPSDFSRRKKSGSLINLLVDWAVRNNVNVNWLLIGEASNEGGTSSYLAGAESESNATVSIPEKQYAQHGGWEPHAESDDFKLAHHVKTTACIVYGCEPLIIFGDTCIPRRKLSAGSQFV